MIAYQKTKKKSTSRQKKFQDFRKYTVIYTPFYAQFNFIQNLLITFCISRVLFYSEMRLKTVEKNCGLGKNPKR